MKKVISKKVFEKEISICRQLSCEKGGCNWGKCEKCGVVPLLYKLYKGILLEKLVDIKQIKKKNKIECQVKKTKKKG